MGISAHSKLLFTPYQKSSDVKPGWLQKIISQGQWISKSNFLNFMSKENPSNEHETKEDIFPRDIFRYDIIFIGRKILNHKILYFNDFYNWQFSISLEK